MRVGLAVMNLTLPSVVQRDKPRQLIGERGPLRVALRKSLRLRKGAEKLNRASSGLGRVKSAENEKKNENAVKLF